MQIRIKAMGALRGKLPAGAPAVEASAGASVSDLLQQIGLSAGHVHLVMVNGEMETNRGRLLAEGDELTIFPPVAGG